MTRIPLSGRIVVRGHRISKTGAARPSENNDAISPGVVIPYGDRAQHLDEFLRETTAFFESDGLNSVIRPRFLIVEQAPGLAFNRGGLLNVGCRLLADAVDYLCLHDVDRIPVSTDYRWPDAPTMIIREGLPLPAGT